jgi:phosphoribosylformylglycinamidine cyclo-ligase
VVDRATWRPQPIFELLAATGGLALADLEQTFNLGVGMIAVVAGERVDDALACAQRRGLTAWRLGEVRPGQGTVTMVGRYQGPAADWA